MSDKEVRSTLDNLFSNDTRKYMKIKNSCIDPKILELWHLFKRILNFDLKARESVKIFAAKNFLATRIGKEKIKVVRYVKKLKYLKRFPGMLFIQALSCTKRSLPKYDHLPYSAIPLILLILLCLPILEIESFRKIASFMTQLPKSILYDNFNRFLEKY
ncbi:hypothetical protein BpHYR1_022559 [Brachionus plicatilis]|uniref:Uncharacterized protein n=1 Tax=Brachionus plicatilis TaxID=10195 RepID=A0A3M7PX92_BRAPC|nr:hypothetical protein BpHYR1_022559 [Brachionus plicatilis]